MITALVRKQDGVIITDSSATEDADHARVVVQRSPDEQRERYDFATGALRAATKAERERLESATETAAATAAADRDQALVALRDAIADAIHIDPAVLRAAHVARLRSRVTP